MTILFSYLFLIYFLSFSYMDMSFIYYLLIFICIYIRYIWDILILEKLDLFNVFVYQFFTFILFALICIYFLFFFFIYSYIFLDISVFYEYIYCISWYIFLLSFYIFVNIFWVKENVLTPFFTVFVYILDIFCIYLKKCSYVWIKIIKDTPRFVSSNWTQPITTLCKFIWIGFWLVNLHLDLYSLNNFLPFLLFLPNEVPEKDRCYSWKKMETYAKNDSIRMSPSLCLFYYLFTL